MTRVKDTIRVQVPFSVTDIRQCKEKLGRHSEESSKFADGFQTLILAFSLLWRDIQFVLASCCIPTKKDYILETAHRKADEIYVSHPQGNIPEPDVVQFADPSWNYYAPDGMAKSTKFLEALIKDMRKGIQNPVNYEKLKTKEKKLKPN